MSFRRPKLAPREGCGPPAPTFHHSAKARIGLYLCAVSFLLAVPQAGHERTTELTSQVAFMIIISVITHIMKP